MPPGHRDRHDPLLNLRAVGDTGRVSGDRHVTLGGSATEASLDHRLDAFLCPAQYRSRAKSAQRADEMIL